MQKLHKIAIFVVAMTWIACSGLMADCVTNRTEKTTIEGQIWFESMKRKYPAAGLDQVNLEVSYGWVKYLNSSENGLARIGCPHDKYYGLKPFEPEDEWCLLHEAGHVHKYG